MDDLETHQSQIWARGLPPVQLRIRPGMDVYSSYQDQFIGSVVRVWHAATMPVPGAREVEKERAVEDVMLVHEEGHAAGHTSGRPARAMGEEMGPGPTVSLGNTGPVNQSAGRDYGTRVREPGDDVVYFAVRPGRINLGVLTTLLYVPSSAVDSVSMERIVLGVTREQIPAAWRRRPNL